MQDIGVTADVLQLSSDEPEAGKFVLSREYKPKVMIIITRQTNPVQNWRMETSRYLYNFDPEVLLNKEGRELMISRVSQRNVSARI